MAGTTLTTPLHCDADENDCKEFAKKTAISDYLNEVDVSPTSLLNNRGPGFGLLHTKLSSYDEEEQSIYRSPIKSKESEFYLKSCVSSDRNSMSPLYAASSAASTASSSSDDSQNDESDFLTEARASFLELDALHISDTGPCGGEQDASDSSDDSSTNTYSECDEDSDRIMHSKSAFSFDDFHGPLGKNRSSPIQTPRSCPDIYARKRTVRPSSTKSWLQEIKDEELLQRQRIAGAIAATKASTPKTPASGLRTKRSPSSFFRNKENVENHPASERKAGRNSLMKSIRRSWTTPTANAGSRPLGRRDSEQRDDRNHSTPSSKELQLKRAFLGSARVLTMDGIVESFASDPEAAVALSQSVNGERIKFAPTSDAPLTWV